ncbi:hypothetical protein G7046_g6335 [Stylonectria norvegica]|nr:hypothetical protein G7046_g6335 [Stylonectria norvegica]
MAANGSFTHQEQYKGNADQFQPTSAAGDSSAQPAAGNNLSKDEVGWYFVEQYYTTLSKSPEKLHLFYGKRSQFVYGLEAEVANVSVGRQAIQERIKQLDFQDCKVRVSNVDSQASFDNIVIQVIGETSNKAGEPKKFVQTFVLAQQPSGYFVLNDILRYIDEESDDESAETAAEETIEEPEAAVEAAAPVEPEVSEATESVADEVAELDPEVVDQKLEEVSTTKDATVNGSTTESSVEDIKTPDTKSEVTVADPESAVQELAEEDAKITEKPKDPTPTPVTKPAAPAPPPAAEPVAPAAPAAPPKPMTWASRIAAAAGPKPVVPLAKTTTPPAQAQSRAPAPAVAAAAAAPTSAPAAAAPTAAAATKEAPAKEAAGWQTAGADSKRQNRPQSISGPITEKEGTLGYVKYVTEKVQEADLRDALVAHGELTYFDINRQKNCAFVEYKTPEGYQAAVAANPHIVNGENIVVEPRRPKANAYGGTSYGNVRGGSNTHGRGRGGFETGRTGSQGGSRGNFSGQTRGRGGYANRGRGAGAPAAANNA